MKARTAIILGILCLLLAVPSSSRAQRDMTIKWIYGDSASWVSTPPSYLWLADGTMLLLDTQKPIGDQTFELFDPRTGNRKPALNMKKALANLKALVPEDTSSSLRWPISVDAAGKQAIYLFSGDIFLLNLEKADFGRITRTPSEERSPTISPDGKRIAFVRDNDLFFYDIGLQREHRITQDGNDSLLNGIFSWVYWEEIFNHRDAAYWWSPDSRSIAFLRSDDSSVGMMCFPDFQPYQPTIHKQRYPKAGQPNPSVKLGVANTASGEVVWMHLPSAFEYIVRVNWVPGNNGIAVQTMNRAQTEVVLWLVDRSTGSATTVLKESDDAWLHHYEPIFSRDAKYFIWISERSGFAHAYRYSITGKLLNQVTKGDWSLCPFGQYSAGGESALRAIDEKEGTLYFTAAEKSSQEQQLYRVQLDGTGFKRLTRADGHHGPEFSPDGNFYLDTYSNATTPPTLLLCRSDGTLVQTVSNSRADLIASFDLQYPSFFTVPARDDFALPAQMAKPKSFGPGKKYPVIVHVYGGPGSAMISRSWRQSIFFDQVLLNEGFLVAKFDNRSSAAIGKKFEKSIKGQTYGDVELHDLEDVVRWLKAQTYVDSNRIGIWGWSGGGMYTLLALTRTKDFKAGIAVAPVTDWHYYDTKFTELWMKTPQENPEGYAKTSLVKRAADLHGQLFLTHGTYDDNVHPQNSQAFMNELIKAGITFDFMVYPMRQHTIDDAPARIHLFNSMLDFWRRSL